jgi:hypothetical protein
LTLPPGSSAPTASLPDPGKITITKGTASVLKRRLTRLRLSCSGERGASCSGILALTTKVRVKVRVREIVRKRKKKRTETRTVTKTETRLLEIGTVAYSLRAHTSQQVPIHLSRRAVRLLTRARHHRLRTRASASGVVRNVILRPARKRKGHRHKAPSHKHSL